MPEYQTCRTRRHRRPPRLGEDGAAGDHGHDRSRVGGRHRRDERLVGPVEREPLAIAPCGEARARRCRGWCRAPARGRRRSGPRRPATTSGSSADGQERGEVRRCRTRRCTRPRRRACTRPPRSRHRPTPPARPPRPGRRHRRGAPRRPGGRPGARRGGSRPRGVHVARPAVAEVPLVGQPAEDRDPAERSPASRGSSGAPSTGSLRSSTIALAAASRARARWAGEASTSSDTGDRSRSGSVAWRSSAATVWVTARVDRAVVDRAGLDRRAQVLVADHASGHLHVEAGVHRRGGVAEPEDPVADDEAVEAPLVAERSSVSSVAALAAPLAVDGVVGAHHAGHALVDDRA